ncbi:hypothetical protein BDZ89DRAFT_1154295 [Hymenopellis radicata]|nr:hypothetical protein BDZ89DRAFT_1154295 [Hymenopellis radicata]
MDGPSPTAPLAPTMTVLSPTVTVPAPFLLPYYAFIASIVSLTIVTVTSTVVFRRTTPTNARTIQHLSLTPPWVEGYSLPPMIYSTACLLVGAILLSSFTLMFDSVVRLCFGLTSIMDDTLPVLYAFILLVAILGVFDDNLHFMGIRIALFSNEQQQSFYKVETITPKAADPCELPTDLNPPVERPDAELLLLSWINASSPHFSLESTPSASPEHTSRSLLDDTAAQLATDTQDDVLNDNSYNPTLGVDNEDTHTIVCVSVDTYTIQTTKLFQAETVSTLDSICKDLQQQKLINNELNKTLGRKSQQLEKENSSLQGKCSRLENDSEAQLDTIRSLNDQIRSQEQEIGSKDDSICVKDDTILKQTRLVAFLKKQNTLLQKKKDAIRDMSDEQASLFPQETLVRERYESLQAKQAAEDQLGVEIQTFQHRENGLKALLTEKNADLEKASSDLDDSFGSDCTSNPSAALDSPGTRTVPATTSYSAGSRHIPLPLLSHPPVLAKSMALSSCQYPTMSDTDALPLLRSKHPLALRKLKALTFESQFTRTETLLPRFDGTKPR